MEQQDNLLAVIQTIWAWRRAVLGVSLAAGLATAGISLLLPNYYRSTTVFLAANPNQARPEILFGKGNAGTELYGGGNDIDRLLSIAESNELIDYLVDSFQLYEHYRINPNHPKASHKVRLKFRSLYEIKKTKLDAVELSVEDRDPQLAAAISNAARERINELGEGIIKENQRKTLESYRENIQVKDAQLKVLGDSLARLRNQFGIYNLLEQSRQYSEQIVMSEALLDRGKGRLESMRANPRISRDSVAYTEAFVNGLQREVDSLKVRFQRFNEGQLALTTLETQYFAANGQYGEDVERAKLLDATLQAQVPALYVVEPAEVPVEKSRPKRSIIVLTAGVLAFLMSILAILLLDAYREFDWKALIHGQEK